MRPHWDNCITHFDEAVDGFVADYFAGEDRTCLLVAGAGFDPRARHVAQRLSAVMGDRLEALFIREDRLDVAEDLKDAAAANEQALRDLVPRCDVEHISVFAEDLAPVGGARVSRLLNQRAWPQVTDVVLDLSALSVGIGFPAARLLLEKCESLPQVSFHLMVTSNPELDARIIGEPSASAVTIRGFAGEPVASAVLPLAQVWLPQLAPRKHLVLQKINAGGSGYKVCPILPFPARDPRRADALLAEYEPELRNEWQVDSRDLIYVSERNPLDTYRTVSMLKQRYDATFAEVYTPQIILSPVGSKVMAAGALMAAIEHNLVVRHVESLRYELDRDPPNAVAGPDMIVHVWLHGPVYAGYFPPPLAPTAPPDAPLESDA
jgi:hypothetical protein